MRSILLLNLFLLACDNKEDRDDDDRRNGGNGSDSLENIQCQDVNGSPAAGASVYYQGSFTYGNAEINGTEYVHHIANEHWDYGDCTITLGLTGVETTPVGCTTCDLAFSITATLDQGNSDCPEDLQEDYSSYSTIYNIELYDDGTTEWFFDSGNQFASGTHNGDRITYLSEEMCQWY